jgi:hypothetical protein
MPSRLGGFETRFRCLSPAPAASSASSFVAPPDLAALRRIRGRVGDRRAYTSSLERESLRGQRGHSAPQGSGFGLAMLPDPTSRRVPPSRTRSISRDRSVERSADSPEVVSRFEFAAGRSKEILKTHLGSYTEVRPPRVFVSKLFELNSSTDKSQEKSKHSPNK